MKDNIEYAAIESARRSSLFNRKEAFAKSGSIHSRAIKIDKDSLDIKSSRELLLELPNLYVPHHRRRSNSFANLSTVGSFGPVQSIKF